jgi:regulator of protease activity HflC (stomatin/prohibitin superfamily)
MPLDAIESLRGLGGSSIGPHSRKEEAAIIAAIARDMPGALSFNDVLFRPNAQTLDAVINVINNGREPPASAAPFGKLIPNGSVGIIEKNGELFAVGRGTYVLPNPRASWAAVLAIDRGDVHAVGQLTVLRVPKEDYALCTYKNAPVVVSASAGSGFVVMNDGFFRYVGSAPANAKHTQHGILHLVRVDKGYLAKVTCENTAALLPTGFHVYRSATFAFDGFELVNTPEDDCTEHRTITRFDLRAGMLALVWYDNQPYCIKQSGVYLVDSLAFRFDRFTNIHQTAIVHGTLQLLRIDAGFAGVILDHGKLRTLKPGSYEFNDPDIFFRGIFSTTQEYVDLGGYGANRAQTREFVDVDIVAVAFFRVKDPIKLLVTVGNMDNVKRFIDEYCSAALATVVRNSSLRSMSDKSVGEASGGGSGRGRQAGDGPAGGTMTAKRRKGSHKGSMRNETPRARQPDATSVSADDGDSAADARPHLPTEDSNIAAFVPSSSSGSDKVDESSGDETEDAKLSYVDRIAAQVHRDLHRFMRSTYGVELLRLRISDIKVLDPRLRDLLSQQSRIAADTQSKLTNIKDKKRIEIGRVETKAVNDRVQADIDAHKIVTAATATRNALVHAARARSEATLLEVEASARAAVLIATAEAERLRLMGEADAERVRLVGATTFGRELALAKLRTECVRDSMAGTTRYVQFVGTQVVDVTEDGEEIRTPRGMIFEPGDAVPGAGTWNGEELAYVADREQMQRCAQKDEAAKQDVLGRVLSVKPLQTKSATILSVPSEEICARAYEFAVQRTCASVGAEIDLKSFQDILQHLFPSSISTLLGAPITTLAACVYQDEFAHVRLGWSMLQRALWYVASYANILNLLDRFEDVSKQQRSTAALSTATAADGLAERRVSYDDLCAANALLGISADLKSVFTQLDGFSRGYVLVSQLSHWIANARPEMLKHPQKPFNALRYASETSAAERDRQHAVEGFVAAGDRTRSRGAVSSAAAQQPELMTRASRETPRETPKQRLVAAASSAVSASRQQKSVSASTSTSPQPRVAPQHHTSTPSVGVPVGKAPPKRPPAAPSGGPTSAEPPAPASRNK